MTQSVITSDTLGILVGKLEQVVDRELTGLEKSLIDYTLIQIQLGLVEVK
jgi:hypothetical protein